METRSDFNPRRRACVSLLGIIFILGVSLLAVARGQDIQLPTQDQEFVAVQGGLDVPEDEPDKENTGPTYIIDPVSQAVAGEEEEPVEETARKSRLSTDLVELMNYTAAELSVAQSEGKIPTALPPVGDDRRIIVDIHTDTADDVPGVLAQLEAMGFESTGELGNIISGWINIDALAAVENIPEVTNCYASNRLANAGKAMSEGDRAMGTDKVRASLGLTGKGMTIAVLSDSYNTLGGAAADIASGDLPSDIEIYADWTQGRLKDEGRAMLQLVHDCAPEAKLMFSHVWGGIAQFALAIQGLAGCPPGSSSSCKRGKRKANVIVDDVFYFGEPFFQDGLIAQAVDIVTKAGIVYVAAAGNYARQAWEGNARLTGAKIAKGRWANFQGGYMHDFTGRGTYYQRIKVPASGQMWFTFQWQQPFASAGGKKCATDWDIYLFDDTNNDGTPDVIVKWATTLNLNGDAVEYLGYKSTYGSEHNYFLALVQATGSKSSKERLKWLNTGVGVPIDAVTNSPTLFGHANADGAVAVGAASARQTPSFGVTPANPEAFTAWGTTRIYFDKAGNAIDTKRSHPDVVGPDGTLNTFFGGYNRFYGTSAAAPHIAAVGAIMLQIKPCMRAKQVRQFMRDTALDMKDPYNPTLTGFDWTNGRGFINAVAAVNAAKAFKCSTTNVDEDQPIVSVRDKKGSAAGVVAGVVSVIGIGTVLIVGTLFLVHRRRTQMGYAGGSTADWPQETEPTEEKSDLTGREWRQKSVQLEPTSSPLSPPMVSPARQGPSLQ